MVFTHLGVLPISQNARVRVYDSLTIDEDAQYYKIENTWLSRGPAPARHNNRGDRSLRTSPYAIVVQ